MYWKQSTFFEEGCSFSIVCCFFFFFFFFFFVCLLLCWLLYLQYLRYPASPTQAQCKLNWVHMSTCRNQLLDPSVTSLG